MGDRLPDQSPVGDVTGAAGWHSVMLPAYGDGPHLRSAIDSVVAQDTDAWRLVILDDGPRDPVLADWADGLHVNVSYRHNPKRLGINANFAQAMACADGDLVTVLGADDRLALRYVSTMRDAARANPEVAWIHPRVRVIDAGGHPAWPLADRVKSLAAITAPAVVGGEDLAVSLLRGNWMYFPSVAFRREIVAPYSFTPGLAIVLDLDLYIRLLLDGHTAALIEEEVFDYRRHDESLSSVQRVGPRFREEATYFTSIRPVLADAGWRRAEAVARRHVLSRLHAAALLPGTFMPRTGRGSDRATLVAHAIGRPMGGVN